MIQYAGFWFGQKLSMPWCMQKGYSGLVLNMSNTGITLEPKVACQYVPTSMMTRTTILCLVGFCMIIDWYMNAYLCIHDAVSLVGEVGHNGKVKQGNNQSMVRHEQPSSNIR